MKRSFVTTATQLIVLLLFSGQLVSAQSQADTEEDIPLLIWHIGTVGLEAQEVPHEVRFNTKESVDVIRGKWELIESRLRGKKPFRMYAGPELGIITIRPKKDIPNYERGLLLQGNTNSRYIRRIMVSLDSSRPYILIYTNKGYTNVMKIQSGRSYLYKRKPRRFTFPEPHDPSIYSKSTGPAIASIDDFPEQPSGIADIEIAFIYPFGAGNKIIGLSPESLTNELIKELQIKFDDQNAEVQLNKIGTFPLAVPEVTADQLPGVWDDMNLQQGKWELVNRRTTLRFS